MADLAHEWQLIDDLPEDWQDLSRPDLLRVRDEWLAEKAVLTDPEKLKRFEEKLHTLWAIETGIIEKLYTVDRGVTESLIEIGLTHAEELRARGKLTTKAQALIQDQRDALEHIFAFVKSERKLSSGYMKEMHAVLTRRQETTEAVDQLGRNIEVPLSRGMWKTQPNNPVRRDGLLHEYCPPDFVQDEIDSLVNWQADHEEAGVPAEIAAAWLHHRFTQIHPFQDGNGRVARALATIVFVKNDFLPLVIRDTDHRERYLDGLASADDGDLGPLVDLFSDIQINDLTEAISAVRSVRGEGLIRVSESAAAQVARRLAQERDEIDSINDDLVRLAEQVFEGVAEELQRSRSSTAERPSAEENEHYWTPGPSSTTTSLTSPAAGSACGDRRPADCVEPQGAGTRNYGRVGLHVHRASAKSPIDGDTGVRHRMPPGRHSPAGHGAGAALRPVREAIEYSVDAWQSLGKEIPASPRLRTTYSLAG